MISYSGGNFQDNIALLVLMPYEVLSNSQDYFGHMLDKSLGVHISVDAVPKSKFLIMVLIPNILVWIVVC